MPYKTEKGVPPRATVERIMPSGLANHNAQGECAIALYMAPSASGQATALSRLYRGFESRWGHQEIPKIKYLLYKDFFLGIFILERR